MKTNVTYGIGIAVAGALFTLVVFFLGLHNDAEKMKATSSVVGLVGILIPIIGLVLALRAKRAASPNGGMSYGQGVLTAFLVGVIAGVLGAIFNYIYAAMINPDMVETMRAMQIAELEAKSLPQDQINAASGIMNVMTSPPVTSAMVLLFTPILYTVIGLIAAIFIKRAPTVPPPPPVGSVA